ncbi:glycosyltransferase family 4 protein [Aquicoccus sp.]|uniref:glycosyltransferase family 4 protein n=1 Tax=Aquicoccus sp. TaxID=2055851 RepID=UPI003567FE4B
MLAEAANPEWVSVPLVGWSLFDAVRRVADVHLVTQIRNRDAILRAGLVEGRDFTVIDTERLERPLWKLGKTLRLGWTSKMALNALSYPYFERLVWARFGDEILSGAYDIVHRVTPLSPTVTSSIAARCAAAGIPFVLGPLNGGLPWPQEFDAARRKEKEWLSYIRGAYRLTPGRRRMLEATSALLAGSRHTASELPGDLQDRVTYLPENAIETKRFGQPVERPSPPPLRACFVGRLVPYKGPDMLLEAAAPLLADGRLTLDIVGDGPMMSELRAFVTEHDLGSAVTFHGWVTHEEVPRILGRAHVLTFPSIREFGGGVVLEAMALGVVPIVVDYGGPGELVGETTGYKVPIGPRPQIVAALQDRLVRLAAAPEVLAPLSAAARDEVLENFTWDAKARKILSVYTRLRPPGARADTASM